VVPAPIIKYMEPASVLDFPCSYLKRDKCQFGKGGVAHDGRRLEVVVPPVEIIVLPEPFTQHRVLVECQKGSEIILILHRIREQSQFTVYEAEPGLHKGGVHRVRVGSEDIDDSPDILRHVTDEHDIRMVSPPLTQIPEVRLIGAVGRDAEIQHLDAAAGVLDHLFPCRGVGNDALRERLAERRYPHHSLRRPGLVLPQRNHAGAVRPLDSRMEIGPQPPAEEGVERGHDRVVRAVRKELLELLDPFRREDRHSRLRGIPAIGIEKPQCRGGEDLAAEA